MEDFRIYTCVLLIMCSTVFLVTRAGPTSLPSHIRTKLCGLFSIHYEIKFDDNSWTVGPARERCSEYHVLSYLRARAMIYAIDEINHDSDILRNIHLEYDIRDICNWKSCALRAASQCLGLEYDEEAISLNSDPWIANQTALLFIGPDTSATAETVADYAQNFGVPLISYSATSALLGDRTQYRTFFRTVPSDLHQAAAVAELIASFGWNWVGLIVLDNSYGRSVASDFRSRAADLGICIGIDELVSSEVDENGIARLVDAFNETTLEVIVAFTYTKTLRSILEETKESLAHRKFTWIASDIWATSTDISSRNFGILGNVLGVVLQTHVIPGYRDYLSTINPTRPKFKDDTWLREMWETKLDCRLNDRNKTAAKLCASHTLFDVAGVSGYSTSFSLYHVYLAVHAAAHTLSSIEQCTDPYGLLADGQCPDPRDLESWQLINYLNQVNFSMPRSSTMDTSHYNTFTEKGEMRSNFCIIHWKREAVDSGNATASDSDSTDEETDNPTTTFEEIGQFVLSNDMKEGVLTLDTSKISWHQDINNGQPPKGVCQEPCAPGYMQESREGSPACCFDCNKCAVGTITNQSGRTSCMPCPEGYWSNDELTACVAKTIDVLVWSNPIAIFCLLLCGIGVVCTLVSLGIFIHHHETAVVRASNRPLSYCLLCLLMVGFVEPVLYVGEPSTWTCNFRIALHSVLNAAILALFLVKTRRILAVFDTSSWRNESLVKRFLRNTSAQVALFVLLWVIQVAVVTVYLTLEPSVVEVNNIMSTTKVYIVCKSNLYCFIVMYSYIALIAIICFVLSFRARKIPANFHETRYITVTMMFYIVIWVVSLPLYFSVNGSLQSLLQMITTWLSNAMILGFMFVPKCYIILARPETNTSNNVRRKASKFPVGGEFQSSLANNDATHLKPRAKMATTSQ